MNRIKRTERARSCKRWIEILSALSKHLKKMRVGHAAAWEKMEARLEQVLVRLDRANAGLQVKPEAPAREPREGALKSVPEAITQEDEEKEERVPGARGEPLGAPGGDQMPGGGQARGQLEKEVSALRLSNSNLLEELGALGRERQRLQGELQSLSQRLQRECVPRPEAQVQLQQLRRSVGLLTDELALEKEAAEKLRKRLASHNRGLQGLWDCLPPDLVGQGSARTTVTAPLEELQACISALVARHREAQQQLARLEEENQQLRGSPSRRGEPRCGEASASPQVAALEQDLGKLEEEDLNVGLHSDSVSATATCWLLCSGSQSNILAKVQLLDYTT